MSSTVTPEDIRAAIAAGTGTVGPTLFKEVKAALHRYLHWPHEWEYDLTALWVMETPIALLLPSVYYLHFSASKGKGKTTALDVIAALTGALNASDISVASLVHWLADHPGGAVCADEYDVNRNAERAEALAAIARNGYTPGKPYLRWDPTKKVQDECPTYGAKVFGFRGLVDDALEDRGFTLPLPTVALRGKDGAKMVARNMDRSFGDLPARLREWGARTAKEWTPPIYDSDEWCARTEAVVGDSLGANRETQLCMVALAVADAVGVDVSDSLRAAFGLKREVAEANVDVGIEDAREVIEEIIGRTGVLTKEAEFYVVRQKDFTDAINARRKERRERPLTSAQIAKLRNDLGIDPAWLTHSHNRVTWNIPQKEWERTQGVANPPNPPNPNGDADRVRRVSQVSQGAPEPPSSPVAEESHLSERPTLADQALANARREGSLAPEPSSSNPYYYPPGGYKPGEAPTTEIAVERAPGVRIWAGEVFYNPPAPSGPPSDPPPPSTEERERWRAEWERDDGDPSALYPGGVLARRFADPPDNVLYRPPEGVWVVHEASWETAGSGATIIYSDGAVVRRSSGEVIGRFRVAEGPP